MRGKDNVRQVTYHIPPDYIDRIRKDAHDQSKAAGRQVTASKIMRNVMEAYYPELKENADE